MCGVFGFDKKTNATQFMTPALALFMEMRGHQSWGVTNGTEIYKRPSSIQETFEEQGFEPSLYHTRAASVGEVSEANAHPFQSIVGTRRVTGVHNGHISNHSDLDKKYSRDFAVDSMHIFQHLAEGKDVAEIDGWGAVVWTENCTDRPGIAPKIYFSRFNTPDLHICKLDTEEGELVWASTKHAIEVALKFAGLHPKFFYNIEERTKYCINAEGRLEQLGPMNWSKNITRTATGSCGYDLGSRFTPLPGREVHSGWICAMPHCTRTIDVRDWLLCKQCFAESFDQFVELESVATAGAC